jgi:hypothetical protein
VKSHAAICGLSFTFYFYNLLTRVYKMRPLCSQGSAFGHETSESVPVCWSQLGSFPGIYCVCCSPWFPHSESTSSFLLALQSYKPPGSSAVFPVTVTTFCRELGDKLCKYLTQLLTQIGARGFEKLFPESTSIINSLLPVKMVSATLFPSSFPTTFLVSGARNGRDQSWHFYLPGCQTVAQLLGNATQPRHH